MVLSGVLGDLEDVVGVFQVSGILKGAQMFLEEVLGGS